MQTHTGLSMLTLEFTSVGRPEVKVQPPDKVFDPLGQILRNDMYGNQVIK